MDTAEEQGVAVAEKQAVAVEKKWEEERKTEAALRGGEKEEQLRGDEKRSHSAQDHGMPSTEEEGIHFLPPGMAAAIMAVEEKQTVAVEKWEEERKPEAALRGGGGEKEEQLREDKKKPQLAQDHGMPSTEEEGVHFLPPGMAAATMAVSKAAIEPRCSTDGSDGARRFSPEEDALLGLPAPLNPSRDKYADGDNYNATLAHGGGSNVPAGTVAPSLPLSLCGRAGMRLE